MKRALIFLLAMISPVWVLSHNPVAISVEADFSKNQLSISIRHPVTTAREHFIRRVVITVDDREPIVETFHFQKGGYKHLTVDIADLDTVEQLVVEAYSNKGGSLKEEFSADELGR